MLGYYNRSVILTYIGLISAVVGCRFVLLNQELAAVFCLLICGLCDLFDGPVARATNRSKEAQVFGIQIDSLCDLVGFGILPAVILCGVNPSPVHTAVAALFALAAVIRLGFFNVHEQIRQETTSEDKCASRGLPVTFAAWIIPSVFAFRPLLGFKWFPLVLMLVMLAVAILFVLDFQLRKPRRKILLYIAGCIWILVLAILLFMQWYN